MANAIGVFTFPPHGRGMGDEPLRPPRAGTSPFRGGFVRETAKRLPLRRVPRAQPTLIPPSQKLRWSAPSEFSHSPPPRTVAAALSAAVTPTNSQESAPNSQGHIVCKKNQLEPQPLFGRGPGGGASLREAASPGVPPPLPSFREGARGRGTFYRKSPSLALLYYSYIRSGVSMPMR